MPTWVKWKESMEDDVVEGEIVDPMKKSLMYLLKKDIAYDIISIKNLIVKT